MRPRQRSLHFASRRSIFYLNPLCVDGVVLRVRADEPDIDHPAWVVDPHDEAILVACYVEHHTTVFQDARRPDFALHAGGSRPIGSLHLADPCHERIVRVDIGWAPSNKSLQPAHRNDPHPGDIAWSRFGTKP